MQNCRKAWDEPVGYRPDLYKHWTTGRMNERYEEELEEGDQEGDQDDDDMISEPGSSTMMFKFSETSWNADMERLS